MRHARRAPPPRRRYAEPYECAPPRRARLRALLRPRARPPCADVVYNLLQSRAGALATVVYSDRYFRYGLPLRARAAPQRRPAPGPAHHVPLRAPALRLAPGAGLLLDATRRVLPAARRYAPVRREPRTAPVFQLLAEPRFELAAEAPAGGARRRELDYRQARSAAPAPLRPAARRCAARRCASPPREPRACSDDEAPRPQFALPDEEQGAEADAETAAEGAEGAEGVRSRRASSVTWAEAAPALERKVLNTERFNNGALGLGRGAGRGAGGPRGAGRLRAGVRALLACSGLFYALALLAFYFLSIA